MLRITVWHTRDTEEYCCFYRRNCLQLLVAYVPACCIIYQCRPVEVVALLRFGLFWASTVKVIRLGNSHKKLFINSEEICAGFHRIDTFSVCYSNHHFWCLCEVSWSFCSLSRWWIQDTTYEILKENNMTSVCCLGLEWIYAVILPLVPFLKNLRFCISLRELFNLVSFYLLMFTCIAVTLTSQYSMVLVYSLFPHPHSCKKHKSRKISRTWIINKRTEHKYMQSDARNAFRETKEQGRKE